MNIAKIDWESTPWLTVREGVERKSFSGEGATVCLHRLSPNNEQMPHSHPNEQIVYIISGVVDFHVGEEVHRLAAGELIAIPPDIQHYAVVVGDEVSINMDIFTPRRPEYA
jgi:quercetin dioxygenase-like cupin family protein